ncbi:GyrI-like domain-containing protein [Mycoplasma sp. P36-A1]|uniref:GyrI-like domain-containing protein n=1 Tax=Mycoplasma sp. P36-A1 TaxID=3252900 RepID=UPI003C2D24A9
MPRITPFEIIDTPEMISAIFCDKVEHEQLIHIIDHAVNTVEDYVVENRLQPVDTPYLTIPNVNDIHFEIEVGIPVQKVFKESKDIKVGTIPSGKKIVTYYIGDNALMQSLYDELFNEIKEKGHKIDGNIYEYYLNDLDFGKNNLLTKIVVPIK